jgi:hypothetical protein
MQVLPSRPQEHVMRTLAIVFAAALVGGMLRVECGSSTGTADVTLGNVPGKPRGVP